MEDEENADRGVGKGDRGIAANRGHVIKANYYRGQVEPNLAGRLLDMIQSGHFRIVSVKK